MTPLTAVVLIALASAQPQDSPTLNSPSAFGHDVLTVLAHVGLARDALKEINLKNDPVVDGFEMMTAKRKAIERVQDGRNILAGYLKATDEPIRSTAEGLDGILESLQRLWKKAIELDEELVKVKSRADLAPLAAKAREQTAQADEAWLKFLVGMAMVTHVLTDNSRLLDGKVAYLRITKAERQALIDQVGTLFPKAKVKGDAHPVDMAARTFWQWLQKDWRSSDDQSP